MHMFFNNNYFRLGTHNIFVFIFYTTVDKKKGEFVCKMKKKFFSLVNQFYPLQSNPLLMKFTYTNVFSNPRKSFSGIAISAFFDSALRLETRAAEWSLEFREQPEVTRSQIRQIRWLRNDVCGIFDEMVTKNECSVRCCIIVMPKLLAHNSGLFRRIASRKRRITLK